MDRHTARHISLVSPIVSLPYRVYRSAIDEDRSSEEDVSLTLECIGHFKYLQHALALVEGAAGKPTLAIIDTPGDGSGENSLFIRRITVWNPQREAISAMQDIEEVTELITDRIEAWKFYSHACRQLENIPEIPTTPAEWDRLIENTPSDLLM